MAHQTLSSSDVLRLAQALEPALRRVLREELHATPAKDRVPAVYLRPRDIAIRWSCSRSTVYAAISEMAAGGYLERLRVGGRDARIALRSVETFERLHSEPPTTPGVSAAADLPERRKPRPE